MIIGVDGNEANVAEKVGVSVYTLKLLSHFRKKASDRIRFKIYLRRPPQADLPAANRFFDYRVISSQRFWIQFFLPLNLNLKREIGLFFSPAHYSPAFCPVPCVTTIHDLAFFKYPQEFLKNDLYKLRHWTRDSIKRSVKIIAVSKTTKKDIIGYYQVPMEKISVIYNGFEKNVKYPAAYVNDKLDIAKKPYLLYVGTLQPRKNITTLIQAFAILKKQQPQLELIIAGKKGWMYEPVFRAVENLGLEDSVFFTGFVSDQQLAFLYQNALCLVLPSYYEGFGLPILEAMSFGCPVISSFSASLPEIGGEACLYFDPKNEKDLAEKTSELINDGDLRQSLIKKGKSRVKEFSWEKCSEETLNLLTQVHYAHFQSISAREI